jgi:hypothetical protein
MGEKHAKWPQSTPNITWSLRPPTEQNIAGSNPDRVYERISFLHLYADAKTYYVPIVIVEN